jgi:hypothetical protein
MDWKPRKKRMHITPSLSASSLWLMVNGPHARIDEPLRTHVQASLIWQGSEAALLALLREQSRELDGLDDAAYAQRLMELLVAMMQEAEATWCALTEEERRQVALVEADLWHEALRRDLLTEEETLQALDHFLAWNYREARGEIEHLLKRRNPLLRARALEVLVWQWGIKPYQATVLQFVSDDDPHCRRQGLQALPNIWGTVPA